MELHLGRRQPDGFHRLGLPAPGNAIDDLAQLAWYAVPLRPTDPERDPGITGIAVSRTRLAILCSAYGAQPQAVLDALEGLQEREAERIRRLGERGIEPWAGFLARGDATEMREEAHWLHHHRGLLLGVA